ncbi:MAG: hypothetical protein ABI972_23275 [Acidobacteriota bacterium]
MKWRIDDDGENARLFIEHMEAPRFRAEFIDVNDAADAVALECEDALGRFEWIDPRPSDEVVRQLAREADEFQRDHA